MSSGGKARGKKRRRSEEDDSEVAPGDAAAAPLCAAKDRPNFFTRLPNVIVNHVASFLWPVDVCLGLGLLCTDMRRLSLSRVVVA